jgi:hypothetical protein
VGKGKRGRGSWPNGHLPPLARVQNRGGEGKPSGWPAGQGRTPAARARRRPVDRAKRRGRRGGSIHVLTLSWGGTWRWIGGQRRSAGWAALVAARWGARKAVEARWRGGGRRGSPGAICRRPKAVQRGKYRRWGSPVALGGRPDSQSPGDGTARAEVTSVVGGSRWVSSGMRC